MKKTICAILALQGAFAFAQRPKNVILFIGDGMSVPQRMVAEEFSRQLGKGSLSMNRMDYSATTRTCSADSLVTDSAAAATAIACGTKTKNYYSGVDSGGKAVYSCAVSAQKAGKKVGICSNVTITHATPAGFYAHRSNRGDAYGIAIDLANSGFDFFAGGGLDVHDKSATNHPEYAVCGDAYEYARKKGYRLVSTRKEFLALKPGCGRILTRFTNGPLETAIDFTEKTDQPTVAELTAKAIEVLDNEKGFFLMVEGGRIDWAGHANDAATGLRDVLALDAAVKVALAFKAKNPDTLVVVTGDHETGGLSMGFAGTGYSLYLEVLSGQTMSVGRFDRIVAGKFDGGKTPSFDEMKPLLTEAFGFRFASPEKKDRQDRLVLQEKEIAELQAAFRHDVDFHKHKIGENPAYDGEKRYLFGGACRLLLSHKAGLGWSTGAHTAMPVLTTASGPGGDQFAGFIENTDIARRLKACFE